MGSDHGHDHGSCSHDHGKDHSHSHGDEHGTCSHDHAHDHAHGGHGDDHGHHGGEEFVPAGSMHDQFLLLCATVCGLGLCWMMYFWMTGLPLAAVTEHGEGAAHHEMHDMGEETQLKQEGEHASEHSGETKDVKTSGDGPIGGGPILDKPADSSHSTESPAPAPAGEGSYASDAAKEGGH